MGVVPFLTCVGADCGFISKIFVLPERGNWFLTMGYFPILVLVRILKHLPFKDLLSVRRVCCDFSLAVEELQSRLYYVSLHTQERLSDFLQVFSNSTYPIPFSSFILNPLVGSAEDMHTFCDLYAERIIELCIDVRVEKDWGRAFLHQDYEPVLPRYDERLPDYLSFVLRNAKRLEVLQIAPASGDFPNDYLEDFPVVPYLPKLLIISTHWLHTRFCPWILAVIRNAPALQYASRSEFDFHQTYKEFCSRNIQSIEHLGYFDHKKEEWFQARSRLRFTELIFYDFDHDLDKRMADDQARNATLINACQLPYHRCLTWDCVFPNLQQILSPCYFWSDGHTKFTPAHLPALTKVTVWDCEYFYNRNPFPPSASYATVIELQVQFKYFDTDSCILPWPWHERFPNVKNLAVLTFRKVSKPFIFSVQYLVSRFKGLESFCVATHCGATSDVWSLLSGGKPQELDLSKMKSLEYIGKSLYKKLLPSLSASFQNGCLPELRRLSIKSSLVEGHPPLLPHGCQNEVVEALQTFWPKIEATWGVPQIDASGDNRALLMLTTSTPIKEEY